MWFILPNKWMQTAKTLAWVLEKSQKKEKKFGGYLFNVKPNHLFNISNNAVRLTICTCILYLRSHGNKEIKKLSFSCSSIFIQIICARLMYLPSQKLVWNILNIKRSSKFAKRFELWRFSLMIVLTNSNFREPRKINKSQINNCKQEEISVNLEPEWSEQNLPITSVNITLIKIIWSLSHKIW